jgi:hypothetical protein
MIAGSVVLIHCAPAPIQATLVPTAASTANEVIPMQTPQPSATPDLTVASVEPTHILTPTRCG